VLFHAPVRFRRSALNLGHVEALNLLGAAGPGQQRTYTHRRSTAGEARKADVRRHRSVRDEPRGTVAFSQLPKIPQNPDDFTAVLQSILTVMALNTLGCMLAGESTALGVSNSDPYATEPEKSDDWV
jgi:hypothetical protein